MIRLTIPSIEEDDLQAVREVLLSGMLVQGKHVAAFEQAVAAYVGTEHAIAVGNCTAALHLSLLAIGVGPGDHVAVAAYSWPATANVIELCGATPVFVDILPDTYNMDPAALEMALKNTHVKAILPVHTFGQMADMDAIGALAKSHGALVIEDAACALGSKWNGRQAGTFGATGCFSFHPRKAITTGEGGMIVTNDKAVARQCRILRNHGLDPDAPTPDFVAAGFNYRMTEFQAAMGRTQLTKLDRIIDCRRTCAGRYDELLQTTALTPPTGPSQAFHVYQSYVALLPQESKAPDRTSLIALLREQGIEATIGTYHIPLTTMYKRLYGFEEGQFPATDAISARAVSLPLYEKLTRSDQQHVTKALPLA